MATVDDKLTAEVVPLKPFTYDQASAALQAHPRQKNISALARRWGVARGAKITERAELTARIETLQERHTQAIAAAERARAAECGHVGPICRQRETALAAVLADPEVDLKTATTALAALPAVVAGDPAGESQNKVSWSSKREIRLSGLVSAQKSGLFAVGMNASLFAAKNSNGFSEQTISGHSIAGRS